MMRQKIAMSHSGMFILLQMCSLWAYYGGYNSVLMLELNRGVCSNSSATGFR